MSERVGVVAALHGEVAPLIRRAGVTCVVKSGPLRVWESERFVVAYAGMGKARALLACEAVARFPEVKRVVSV
ncbi:MAG: hypothetical protein JOZ43_05665, partial [Acidobacteriales bacterium]|nr:hypothetical protein [Terriglobales bacterium]